MGVKPEDLGPLLRGRLGKDLGERGRISDGAPPSRCRSKTGPGGARRALAIAVALCIAFPPGPILPGAAGALPRSGAVPGYEHIRFDDLTLDPDRQELRLVLENTTPQDLYFFATLFISDREGGTVFRPRLREFLKKEGRTPCRLPLPGKKDPQLYQRLTDLRWEVTRKNRALVEVRPVVSVVRGECGRGFSWEGLRFFGSDYGYEIRGKIVCPPGKASWSRGVFRLRLEDVAHGTILEKDVGVKDLSPGAKRDFVLRGREPTLRELRSLTTHRISLVEVFP